MTHLPDSWATATLGDVIDGFEAGRNLQAQGRPAAGSEFGVLKISAVSWGRFEPTSNKALRAGDRPLPHETVKAGDLLISRANTSELVGAPVLVEAEFPNLMLPDKILRVRYRPEIVDPRYLVHALRSAPARRHIEKEATGTSDSMRNLSQPKLRQIPIPLAPRAEQQRIADKLDALLARIDACRNRLDRLPAILKRFRQAVYEAASTGYLTEDWRVGRARSLEDWSSTSVEEVASLIFDGPFGSNLKSSDYTEAGIRVVRLENIAPLRFIEEKRTYIAEEKFQALARHTLLADDVLFSSFVDEEVRVCLLPPELSGKAINKADCFCIRLDRSRCHPRFLALKLASRSTFSALDDVVHGATRPRINLSQLRAIAFHLPSIDEQTEIVQRVEFLFDLATAIESRLTAARAKVDSLAPALLAKAFTGALVHQDSDEEAAADMLARIRNQSDVGEADRLKRKVSPRSRVKANLVTDMLTRNAVATTHLTDILKERGALTAEALWKASQLEIDDFYEQLKYEESQGLLRENRGDAPNSPRLLESAA